MAVAAIKKWGPMAAAPTALLISGALVWGASNAAFTSKTSNDGNSWAAGTVQLADDDTGTAMFTASGLRPGSTAQRCITVTSTGSLASAVKLYATGYSETKSLGSHVSFVVEEGNGGSFGSCGGFTPLSSGAEIFNGTAAAFSAKNAYGNSVGAWQPAGTQTSETRSYRITYTVAGNTPDSAQGGQVNVGFTWEAQNT